VRGRSAGMGGLTAGLCLAATAWAGGVFDQPNLGGWSASGLWHAVGAAGCVSPHSGSDCAYYGIDSACNYQTGQTQDASLVSPPVSLTSASAAYVTFWLYYQIQSEDPACQDQLTLEFECPDCSPAYPNWTALGSSLAGAAVDPPLGNLAVGWASPGEVGGQPVWQFQRVNMTAYMPGTFTFRFHYLSSAEMSGAATCGPPDLLQQFLGYAVDDVQLGVALPAELTGSVAPKVAAPGSTFTYAYAIENLNLSAAATGAIWDTLPQGWTLESCAPACAQSTVSGGTLVSWNALSLGAGQCQDVTLEAQAPASAQDRTDSASASVSLAPGTVVSGTQTLAEVRVPALTLSKSVGTGQAASGDNVTYCIRVENDTSQTLAAGMTLTDPLPQAFTLAGDEPANSAGTTWTLPALASGAIWSCALWGPVYGTQGQTVLNTAVLSGGAFGNEQASASVTVLKPVQPTVTVRAVYPNPAPGRGGALDRGVYLIVDLDTPMPLTLDLYSVAGELVRSFSVAGVQGEQQLFWDLSNGAGRQVASGIYVYRLWSSLNVHPQPAATGMIAVLQ